jgi:hypothetical protein
VWGVEVPLGRDIKDHLHAAFVAVFADDDFIALFLHLRRASGLDDGRAGGEGAGKRLEQEVVP